ncbi:MAG: hypothetical protein J6Y28_09805 [Acholeplasmatales bacterium]|nr:hypothetical protein [Acholeplasmatales bacterium]
MIEEHAQLVVRTQALHDYVYSEKSDNDNKVEFANKCIQLTAMKKYEEALRARLENQGIEITDDGEYYEKVASIAKVVTSSESVKQDNTHPIKEDE